MKDFTKLLPPHEERFIGENELYLEVYDAVEQSRPPLLFVHGAYTGSWMWCKYIPHFIQDGWKCYVMNMRSHYKSRVMDMTRITFEDYLDDIREMINLATAECGIPPVIIGFSLGGILCQKIAETEKLSGLILADSSVCREVNRLVPIENPQENNLGNVIPAPAREEKTSIDETEDDILFQRKYLSMESSKAFLACGCWIKGIKGISVDSGKVNCPVLTLKAVNSDTDDRRGQAEAEYYQGEYEGYRNMTHTGMLVGQRYPEPVNRILDWLKTKV